MKFSGLVQKHVIEKRKHKRNQKKTSKTTFNNDQQGKKLLGKTGWS